MRTQDHPHHQLIALAAAMNDAVVLYDLDKNKIVYSNERAEQLTDLHTGDAIEQVRRVWQRVAVEDRAYMNSQLAAIRQHPRSVAVEFSMSGSIGKKFIQAKGCVVSDNLLVVFLNDISRIKEHEDYLVEFAAKKNALLDTLTHNLSGSISLTDSLAAQAEKLVLEQDAGKFLSLIRENNEASLRIIEDFVNYEHEKSPKIFIKGSRIDVIEKVRFLYEQVQYSYPNRTFTFSANGPEIHITTDEVKLLQVTNNLLSNAIKFSSPDTTVAINIAAHTDHITITISDQGIGIPAALKPLIFQPQPVTGRPGLQGEPSRGKGLVICKQLVELLSGTIVFTSSEDVGSDFTITLPYSIPLAGQTGIA